jgi:hypothetical protein
MLYVLNSPESLLHLLQSKGTSEVKIHEGVLYRLLGADRTFENIHD